MISTTWKRSLIMMLLTHAIVFFVGMMIATWNFRIDLEHRLTALESKVNILLTKVGVDP